MQGAIDNCRARMVFSSGRLTAEALAPALYLPQPDAVKHVVEDSEYQERSHPVFESIYNQVEVAVQQIMRLRQRHVLVKLAEGEVIELRTPTVPPSRLSQAQLEQIKHQLAKQIGHSRQTVEQEIATRMKTSASTSPPREVDSEAWLETLWHTPTKTGGRQQRVVYHRTT